MLLRLLIYNSVLSILTENQKVESDKTIEYCGCGKFDHELRRDCIEHGCHCCNLEDVYSILTGVDAEKYLRF